MSELISDKPRSVFSNKMPNFPNNPNKNYIPFENPRRVCSVPHCPNFSTDFCGLCDFHCRKIHKGIHTKMETRIELERLIAKYLSDKDDKGDVI